MMNVARRGSFEHGVVRVADDYIAHLRNSDLPEPPELLTRLRARLEDDAFRVLVVGEAKRGKSSFVNALIGEALLPTDVDVATSEVFAVSRTEHRQFRIQFVDGSSEAVNEEALSSYGSQVVIDEQGLSPRGQSVKWIEVGVPAPHLPDRVVLMDTPGLGALYAAHARVTQGLLPLADGVMFVLDAAQPIQKAEIELARDLLAQTDRIFFVMTKIDQHSRTAWAATLERTEQILNEELGAELGSVRVWPISNANLLASSVRGGHDLLLQVSRFPQFRDAFITFLQNVCAKPRAAELLIVTAHSHSSTERLLSRRLAALGDESRSGLHQRSKTLEGEISAFERDWGPNGLATSRVLTQVARVTALAKQALREAIAVNGGIEKTFDQRISEISSVSDANRFGAQLSTEVITASLDQWRRVTESATQQYASAIEPLVEAMFDESVSDLTPDVSHSWARPSRDHAYDKMLASYGQAMPIMMVSGIAVGIFASPLLAAIASGGVLWGISRGWSQSKNRALDLAQLELRKYLRNVVQDVNTYFFSVDIESARFSRVDEHFSALEAEMRAQMRRAADRKASDMRRELDMAQKQESLVAEERRRARTLATRRLDESQKLGEALREVASQHKALRDLVTSKQAE